MFFSKLIIALVSPLGTALAMGIAAWCLGYWHRRTPALVLGGLGLSWLLVWSLPVASHGLRAWVENEFPPVPVADQPSAQAIVVLGGAVSWPRAKTGYPNLSAAADRMWHAARLYHAGKAPLMVLSGGGDVSLGQIPEAELMRRFLGDLGVPDSAMLSERNSLNTRENARFTADLLAQRHIHRVLLVTSALHMGRAKTLFERVGLDVIPAATDYEVTRSQVWRSWMPDTGDLDGSARAMKELVGRWAGR